MAYVCRSEKVAVRMSGQGSGNDASSPFSVFSLAAQSTPSWKRGEADTTCHMRGRRNSLPIGSKGEAPTSASTVLSRAHRLLLLRDGIRPLPLRTTYVASRSGAHRRGVFLHSRRSLRRTPLILRPSKHRPCMRCRTTPRHKPRLAPPAGTTRHTAPARTSLPPHPFRAMPYSTHSIAFSAPPHSREPSPKPHLHQKGKRAKKETKAAALHQNAKRQTSNAKTPNVKRQNAERQTQTPNEKEPSRPPFPGAGQPTAGEQGEEGEEIKTQGRKKISRKTRKKKFAKTAGEQGEEERKISRKKKPPKIGKILEEREKTHLLPLLTLHLDVLLQVRERAA